MPLDFFPPCSHWDFLILWLVFTLSSLSLLLLRVLFSYTHNQYNYPNNNQIINSFFTGFLLAEQWDFFSISSLWLRPSIYFFCFCFIIIIIITIVVIIIVIIIIIIIIVIKWVVGMKFFFTVPLDITGFFSSDS